MEPTREQNGLPFMINIVSVKSWSVRGASNQPVFMGSCLTISHMWWPCLLRQGYHIILFSFGVNQVHCFGLKPLAREEYLMCIVSAKIMELGRRLKCQEGDTS